MKINKIIYLFMIIFFIPFVIGTDFKVGLRHGIFSSNVYFDGEIYKIGLGLNSTELNWVYEKGKYFNPYEDYFQSICETTYRNSIFLQINSEEVGRE